ncbi:MAG: hypothetical protein HY582_01490 [Candidatus Omnitrophica bacterium]|nr:hypothetical protein [Candidatus Omnitrophota bacterium]
MKSVTRLCLNSFVCTGFLMFFLKGVMAMDDQDVLKKFSAYLKTQNITEGNYHGISVQPLGDRGAKFIRASDVTELGGSPTRVYLYDSKGTFRPLAMGDLPALVQTYQDYFSASMSEEKHLNLIRSFIGLNEGGQIISSVSEIPGYSAGQLTPDVEANIQPLASSKGNGNLVVYTIFSYNNVGGAVSKYQFEFDKNGRLKSVEHTILATQVGSAIYYY